MELYYYIKHTDIRQHQQQHEHQSRKGEEIHPVKIKTSSSLIEYFVSVSHKNYNTNKYALKHSWIHIIEKAALAVL